MYPLSFLFILKYRWYNWIWLFKKNPSSQMFNYHISTQICKQQFWKHLFFILACLVRLFLRAILAAAVDTFAVSAVAHTIRSTSTVWKYFYKIWLNVKQLLTFWHLVFSAYSSELTTPWLVCGRSPCRRAAAPAMWSVIVMGGRGHGVRWPWATWLVRWRGFSWVGCELNGWGHVRDSIISILSWLG